MREIQVLSVTPDSVIYEIRVYTPGAGWDGGTKKVTRAEWLSSHPDYPNPARGLKFRQ